MATHTKPRTLKYWDSLTLFINSATIQKQPLSQLQMVLGILGSYFLDDRNKDVAILQVNFERDAGTLVNWFQDGNIVLVDTGDAIPLLKHLGIACSSPR